MFQSHLVRSGCVHACVQRRRCRELFPDWYAAASIAPNSTAPFLNTMLRLAAGSRLKLESAHSGRSSTERVSMPSVPVFGFSAKQFIL